MASGDVSQKPHAVFIPYPAQSHIKAMLKLAKLLHHKGFHITFVNTEFNHIRFLKNRGPRSLDGLPDFHFETIPDGLPPSDDDATQEVSALFESTRKNCLVPFLNLIDKLNNNNDIKSSSENPRVTCIVSDGFMTFTNDAAEKLGIPIVLFWTIAACRFLGYFQLQILMEKGLIPLKDASYLTNGYLDTVIDWIPGMKNIRVKDIPSFLRTTDPNDPLFKSCMEAATRSSKASAIAIHTFYALEPQILGTLSSMFSHVFAIGPLQLLLNQISEKQLSNSVGYNLWKEESECLQWLDTKKPNSVVYVNFGSVVIMTPELLTEFGWGLANSNQYFLWIIRPDLVIGDSAILSAEFMMDAKERGLIATWCPQEQVLNRPSIGGFLTHSGWNSTVESLSAGVPMICLPFFGDQHTNCSYSCNKWGIGVEMNRDVKRDEVEILVRELVEGEKGKRMRNKAMEWKKMAEDATTPNGSSSLNLDKLVTTLLASRK